MTSDGPAPKGRARPRPFVVAAPPALLAAVCAAVGRERAALAFFAAAVVLAHAAVAAPRLLDRLDAGLAAVGRGLGAIIVGVAGALLIVPVWLLQRAVRFDPLVDPRLRGRWRPGPPDMSHDAPRWSRRPFGPQIAPAPRRRVHAQFVVIAPVLVVVAVVAATVGVRTWQDRQDERDAQVLFTSIGEPFGPELLSQFRNSTLIYDAATGSRPADQDDSYVHVHDRIRRSVVPAGAPEATVWFFGGSTMFGLGQRDEHTIPSEIARLAAAEGVTLRVVNYGVLGYVNWQEMQLFSLLLSQGRRPDLAVFYDGCNELALSLNRVTEGEPHPGDPRFLDSNTIERSIDRKNHLVPQPDPRHSVPPEDRLATAITRGADQYRQGTDLIARLAAAYDVPVSFVWQPTLATKPVSPPDRVTLDHLPYPAWSGWTRAEARALQAGILQRSGVDAIDVTAALDGFPIPAYLDECHTSERAARQVSGSLYARLRAAVLAAQAKEG